MVSSRGVLGQLLGEPRLLVQHQPVERGDEVGGRLRPGGQLGAKVQRGAPGGHDAIADLDAGVVAAGLQVATPHAEHLSPSRMCARVPSQRTTPTAYEPNSPKAIVPSARSSMACASTRRTPSTICTAGSGASPGRMTLPRSLDGVVDQRGAVIVDSPGFGLDAAAVLGGPGDEAERHRVRCCSRGGVPSGAVQYT